MKRVEGYMTRAEQLRELVESKPKPVATGASTNEGGDDEEDPEKHKMRNALSGTVSNLQS